MAGYRFRKFPAIKAEQIWENMVEATEEDGDAVGIEKREQYDQTGAGRTIDVGADMTEKGGKR